jgi:hypothetical protein
MAALVDYTYFVDPINIDTSKQVTKDNILLYSDMIEETYMLKLLGVKVYGEYICDKTATRFVDLLKKQSFTYDGITYVNDIKKMAAYFLYFEFTQDQNSFNTIFGEQRASVDNSIVTHNFKLVANYNRAVDMYNIARKYLLSHSADFEGYYSASIKYINHYGI